MGKLIPEAKHVLMPVRVILKRSISKNPWVKYSWSVLNVLPGSGTNDSTIKPLVGEKKNQEDDLFKAETEIDLHRAEAEAYVENLGSSDPSIYVVLRPDAPDDELRRAYYAMKCASLLREGFWSLVSETHSTIDFDYVSYTEKNLKRFEEAWQRFRSDFGKQ